MGRGEGGQGRMGARVECSLAQRLTVYSRHGSRSTCEGCPP